MTYSRLSAIHWITALITLAFSFSPEPTLAFLEQAAPYTVEALQGLNKAALSVPPLLDPRGRQHVGEEGKRKALVNTIYTYWEGLYQQAGYSFEKSLIQLARDLAEDPYVAKNNPQLMLTAFRTTFSAYSQLSGINNQELTVANYLPRSAGEAFATIIRIEEDQRKIAEVREAFEGAMREQQLAKQQERQAENDRKQKEGEAIARQKAIGSQIEKERLAQERRTADQALRDKEKDLAAALDLKRLQGIAGRFVTVITRQNKPLGELEIKFNEAGTMLVNGYDNTYGNKNPELNCQFNDVPLDFKYTTADRTEMSMKDACDMILIFTPNGLTFSPRGPCRSYCKLGDGSFINRQWKRVGP